MNERKNLAALLKPRAGEGIDAVYESTKGTMPKESDPNENFKELSKETKTLTGLTRAVLKEARASAKSLKNIEKALVQVKPAEKPTPGLGGETAAVSAAPTVSIAESAMKKEEEGNANIGADVAIGAVGGGLAAAGTIGLAQLTESISNTRFGKFVKRLYTGNTESQVSVEQQAKANQAADYAAAGETMANAGYTTVTDRRALKPGAKEMQPADFEQAQQAQAAREAVQRGLRQRTRGGGISEPRVPTMGESAQQVEPAQAQVSAAESTSISFSEAKFAEADPENYKRFDEFRRKRYNEIKEEEKKKGLSESTAKEIAEPKARKEAIEKFRKEIEAVSAGSVSTSRDGAPVQPAQPSTVAVQPVVSGARSAGSATQPVQETPTASPNVSGARVTRSEEVSTFDAAKLAEKDPETHAKFVARQQEIIRQRRGELEGLSPRERTRKEERIKAEAFQTAASEYAPQASQVGAASLTSSENIGAISAENKDLGRESSQPSTQPVVIQSNNNMSTQTYTPVPAQPRVESSFSRHQQRNSAY